MLLKRSHLHVCVLAPPPDGGQRGTISLCHPLTGLSNRRKFENTYMCKKKKMLFAFCCWCNCHCMLGQMDERQRVREALKESDSQGVKERYADRLPAYHTPMHSHKSILSERRGKPVISSSPRLPPPPCSLPPPVCLSMKQIQYTVTLSGPRLAIWILSRNQKGTRGAKLIFLLR